jgi:hypothetical protein
MLADLMQNLAHKLGPEARVVPVSAGEALILMPHYALRGRQDAAGLDVALLLPHYADSRAHVPDGEALQALAAEVLADTERNRVAAFCDRRVPLREGVGALMARHGWREHRTSLHAILTTLVYARGTLFLAFFCDARHPELDWAFFLGGSAAARDVLGEGPPDAPRGGQLSRLTLLAERAERVPPDLAARLSGLRTGAREARAVLELEHVALDLLSGDDRPLLRPA